MDLAQADVREGSCDLLRIEVVHLGPGKSVDGQLQWIGGGGSVGLPIDHLETSTAVGQNSLEHRINAADDLTVPEPDRERSLQRVGLLTCKVTGQERLE